MAYLEVSFELTERDAECYSDALLALGALSVSIEDKDSGSQIEQPLFGEPGLPQKQQAWQNSRITVLLDGTVDVPELIQLAAKECHLPLPVYETRHVPEQDWVRLTQSQFDPILIGQDIWVVPSWHTTPKDAKVMLKLDPGLAFGTGSHSTTKLCMMWLASHSLAGCTVLDYGCGSGILAILAKKLGAQTVLGVDVDPQAIQAAQHNAAENMCAIPFHLTDDVAFTSEASHTYDVVVANILTNTLCALVQTLVNHTKIGGYLVLSGVLLRQAEQVKAAYAPFMTLSISQEEEGWVVLVGQKK